MKNTLAENMLRFGAKNLSQESKRKLDEQESTQEWRGASVLTDTTFVDGTAKIYPSLFLKSDIGEMKPGLVVKYSTKTGGFVGMLNAKPTAVYGSTGGSVTGEIEELVLGPSVDPTNWNEYQWIQFLDKLNTNNVLKADGVATFFSSLNELGITTKFGTITPDRLQALKLSPEKITVYTKGIAKAGVNPNFKTV
jgi:hypothetical protein